MMLKKRKRRLSMMLLKRSQIGILLLILTLCAGLTSCAGNDKVMNVGPEDFFFIDAGDVVTAKKDGAIVSNEFLKLVPKVKAE